MALGGVVVTLDALGTLVELEPPAPRLVAELRARGVEAGGAQAAAALRDEMTYYLAHHDLGADRDSLAVLRERCAAVLGDGLARAGVDLGGAAPDALRDALLASLRFRPYADAAPALAALRRAGHRLVVVSNWDVSLHDMLRATGLDALVDGAISSAEAGERKPARGIFERALALAGQTHGTGTALHVGDSLEFDVAGALGAGLRAVLVARTGVVDGVPDDVPVVTSLEGIAALAA